MKKFLLIIFTLILLVSVCGCGKNSDTEKGNETEKDESTSVVDSNTVSNKEELIYNLTEAFSYSEVEDGIVITHFENYDKIEYDKIIVPSEIDGKNVVGIGTWGLQNRIFGAIYGECEVVIPSTVKYIAEMAFNGAEGLVKLSGGENCTKIGEYAFINCINLSEVTFIENVSDLPDNAFAGCEKWESMH